MILQSLTAYYQRLAADPESGLPPPGFQTKELSFIIVLKPDGSLAGLEDVRRQEGKFLRGRGFMVPQEVKRSVNVAANLLWDNPEYALGLLTERKRRQIEKSKGPAGVEKELDRVSQNLHPAFLDRLEELLQSTGDPGVQAVFRFLKENKDRLEDQPFWPDLVRDGGNLSFRLEDAGRLVCQSEPVAEYLAGIEEGGDEPGLCLVSGGVEPITRLHPALKGVRGAQSSGANLVSFNLDAFTSQGKKQSFNAPVGAEATFAYTTALNRLLARDSRQKVQVGDASVVFWAQEPSGMEDLFGDLFGYELPAESPQDAEALRELFSSAHTGARPMLEDPTRFHVLGLSPNAARIAVRFWHQGTVAQVAAAIQRHFDDLAIDHHPHDSGLLPLGRLLRAVAVTGRRPSDTDRNIPPHLAGEVIKAVLSTGPYPQTLLNAAVGRVRAERRVNYPRAAILKAVLNRWQRLQPQPEKELAVSLDESNKSVGYLLGRLFAVLERVQETANPKIKATIRETMYGSASTTPVVSFQRLMTLKNHHLAKLRKSDQRGPGMVVNFEKSIGGIMDGLEDFPDFLSLQEQGRFAVGYYHQRQSFFTRPDPPAQGGQTQAKELSDQEG